MADANQVYRLSDIEVEEVSIVDRAANKRQFLVMKRSDAMTKKATEVKPDGKGNHTVTKDAPPGAPATPPAGAAPAPAPAAPAAPGASTPATPVLSPEAKAELLKRVDMAMTRLAAIKATLDGAMVQEGTTDIPPEVVSAFGDLLHGIAEGDPSEAPAAGAPTPAAAPATKSVTAAITKGRKREGLLRTAAASLQSVLAALDATPADPVAPADVPAPAPTTEGVPAPEVTKSELETVTKAVAKLETSVAVALTKILGVVESQKAAIAKAADEKPLDRGVGGGNGVREDVTKKDGGEGTSVSWPLDMNNPGQGDLAPGTRLGHR